jgi:hypothetical protein
MMNVNVKEMVFDGWVHSLVHRLYLVICEVHSSYASEPLDGHGEFDERVVGHVERVELRSQVTKRLHIYTVNGVVV